MTTQKSIAGTTCLLLISGALLTLAAPAPAQDAREAEARRAVLRNPRLFDPTFDSPTRSANPAVIFSAARGNGVAEAQVGLRAASLSVILAASAPFDEDSDATSDTQLLDLDGPLSGTTVSLTISGLKWGPDSLTAEQDARRETWCKEQKSSDRAVLSATFDCEHFREGDLPVSLRREFSRVRRFGFDIPVQYGLQAKLTPHTFDYTDPVSLESGSSERLGFRVGGGLGIFLTPLARLGLEANYERAYTKGNEVQLCRPLPVVGSSACSDEILGGPTEQSGALLRGSLRRFFSLEELDLAVAPELSYRSATEALVLRAPVYFIPGTDGALTGGIMPVWNFDTERFGLVLFVGPAFGFGNVSM